MAMGIEVALVFFYFDLVYPWIFVFGFEYHGRLIDMRFGRFARKGARGLFAKKKTKKKHIGSYMHGRTYKSDR